jgi:molecular chaperone HtpG
MTLPPTSAPSPSSGTEAFMKDAKDGAPDLIGQFGVGFYSAFMVADKVEVFSRRAGTEKQAHLWTSDGLGTFTVTKAEPMPRGTRIVLHLKDDALDFLEDWKIESIVRSYSDHIVHPILLAGETPRQINTGNAIWMRGKAEVTAEQHKEFFGHVSAMARKRSGAHHPLPGRGPAGIHRAALCAGRKAVRPL